MAGIQVNWGSIFLFPEPKLLFPGFGFLLICQKFRLCWFTNLGISRTARILCELEARLLAGHSRLLFRRDLRQLGGHDAIQLQICGEVIDEWEYDIAVEQQSFTFTGMGNIGQLVGRDVQGVGKNLAVTRRLIQHDDKVRVL